MFEIKRHCVETGWKKNYMCSLSLMLAQSQKWWTYTVEVSGEWNAADDDSIAEV